MTDKEKKKSEELRAVTRIILKKLEAHTIKALTTHTYYAKENGLYSIIGVVFPGMKNVPSNYHVNLKISLAVLHHLNLLMPTPFILDDDSVKLLDTLEILNDDYIGSTEDRYKYMKELLTGMSAAGCYIQGEFH